MRVAIVGSGLAGLAAAVDLVDAGHQVDLYEARPFMGGKVGSWVDEGGNHIEMGLHVFFFNYANLFALLRKVGAIDNLLPKDHTHLFVNAGGDLRELDFRFALGAPFNGLKAFFTTPQLDWIDKLRNALALGTSPIVRGLVDYEGAMKTIRALDRISFQQWFLGHGGSEQSIKRMWNPIAYALGFIDCEAISARCMLTIFMMFAAKTEASKLNLLKGSPHRWLTGPILDYIQQRGGRLHLRHLDREDPAQDQRASRRHRRGQLARILDQHIRQNIRKHDVTRTVRESRDQIAQPKLHFPLKAVERRVFLAHAYRFKIVVESRDVAIAQQRRRQRQDP